MMDYPPPHVSFMRNILAVSDFIRNCSSLDDAKLGELSEKYDCIIDFYDANGINVTSENIENEMTIGIDLSEDMIAILKEEKNYIPTEPEFRDTCFFTVNNKNLPFVYMSVHSRMSPPSVDKRFIMILIFISIILSIAVYPLTKYLTRPLEKITEKAIKFSRGDFSGMEKDTANYGDDEIGKLAQAFNHMASELSLIIEGKKELISHISHELGSPLSRMQLAVELLEDNVNSGEVPSAKIVNKLSKNINEMSKLVKELLDLSRMDRSYILNIEKIDLQGIISTAIQKFQILSDKNNVKINVDNQFDSSDFFADMNGITRAIENLLSNAIDYSPENSRIDILLKNEDGHLLFSIKDEGPGILKENKERIFEAFFREDPSRNRKTGGTGLGLAIVSKIISLHGGKIWVENPGEKGAHIMFKI